VRVTPITAEQILRFDPDLRSFFNANTPEALAEARRLIAAGEPALGVAEGGPVY